MTVGIHGGHPMTTLVQPRFKGKTPAQGQKLRGGYYTPPPLAEYLARWAIRGPRERVLEPSCGDGIFVVAALEALSSLASDPSCAEIVAVELLESEITKARNSVAERKPSTVQIEWHCSDFFATYSLLAAERPFDVILGNPPFIRFQYFNEEHRSVAFSLLRGVGYSPTKLANAWAAFIQLSIELLRPGGRLAMIVPAELLQVKYAAELRSALADKFDDVYLVGFRSLVFPEIQQEVVLLLAEGRSDGRATTGNIHTVEFRDGKELLRNTNLESAVRHLPAKVAAPGMKWTALFLSESSHRALVEASRAPGLIPLGDLTETAVGVVTGRNSFFVVSPKAVDEFAMADFVTPIVARTGNLQSLRFDRDDFANACSKGRSFVLDLTGKPEASFTSGLREYLGHGELEEVHLGYKCRIRKRWYDVPSIYRPDAFLFRQIHKHPLLVANHTSATSTDTIHRVRIKPGVDADRLAARFVNSLTFAWAEVCGRSYGGGVLELEPREADELPIPQSDDGPVSAQLDELLRLGWFEQALELNDAARLRGATGLTSQQVQDIRDAWVFLRDRRTERR